MGTIQRKIWRDKMKLKKSEWVIIGLAIILLFGIAWALEDEKITVSSTVKTLTAAKYTGASSAIFSLEGNDIRVTLDGVTTPTSAGVGILIKKDLSYSNILTSKTAIENFKAVRASGTDATINISYQRGTRIP
jgi:hypothetical protein